VDEQPVVAELNSVEARRISGTREIQLPREVKQELGAQGIRQVMAGVKLCLSADGVPTRVDVVRSTGFPAADAKIRAEMGDWRYRPYTVNGKAVPVCAQVVFRYQIE
jgi:TonB family protein